MRDEFCTLFDRRYAARGVVLARSLADVRPGSRLRVYCMDAESRALLEALDLPGVGLVGIDELEAADEGLAALRGDRTPLEYCWTATPAICLDALRRSPELDAITYLDADLMFFTDPRPIFDELAAGSILLTPHRHTHWGELRERVNGIYNVQFMTFRRDGNGLAALEWWRERCLEWCYARIDHGRWGDQKYLDDWPERFAGVHVLEHAGALAPWNVSAHRLERRDGRVLADGVPLVFFHFAALGLYRGVAAVRRAGLLRRQLGLVRRPLPLVWRPRFRLSEEERELIWEPYVRRLAEAYADLREVVPGFDAGIEPVRAGEALLWTVHRRLGRRPERRWRSATSGP